MAALLLVQRKMDRRSQEFFFFRTISSCFSVHSPLIILVTLSLYRSSFWIQQAAVRVVTRQRLLLYAYSFNAANKYQAGSPHGISSRTLQKPEYRVPAPYLGKTRCQQRLMSLMTGSSTIRSRIIKAACICQRKAGLGRQCRAKKSTTPRNIARGGGARHVGRRSRMLTWTGIGTADLTATLIQLSTVEMGIAYEPIDMIESVGDGSRSSWSWGGGVGDLASTCPLRKPPCGTSTAKGLAGWELQVPAHEHHAVGRLVAKVPRLVGGRPMPGRRLARIGPHWSGPVGQTPSIELSVLH